LYYIIFHGFVGGLADLIQMVHTSVYLVAGIKWQLWVEPSAGLIGPDIQENFFIHMLLPALGKLA
jgi:hypothetical protein